MHDFELKKRQITDRLDILAVASQHVRLKRSGRRWVGLCPFHSEKTPSFTVTPDLGLFKCFGCGKGGDLFSFVQMRENVPFGEAFRMLADRAGVELVAGPTERSQGPGRVDVAKVNEWALRFFRANLTSAELGKNARDYLRGRGFSDEIVERFELGLATDGAPAIKDAAKRAGFDAPLLLGADLVREGDSGGAYETFRNRLIFPIRDATGRVVGFGGRTLVDDRAKYLNTRQTVLFDKGRGLYGIHQARTAIQERGRAVVVEGYTDCLAAHQAGFTETVATLGTAMTESQVDLLRRYGDEIILLFDSDDAGEAAADRAIHVALPRCVRVRLTRIPDGKDPSEFLSHADPEAFSDVLNRAVDALEFKWSQTRARFAGGTSEATRRDAVLDFMRVVAGAADTRAVDAIQRGLLVNQVAHLLQMDRSEVDRLMTRLQSKAARHQEVRATSTRERRSAPRDQAQAAWVNVLEVLLNEPALLAEVGGLPDVERIEDERDRCIAKAIGALFDEFGEFGPADVLVRCHEEADAARVAELASRGAARSNYESTLRLALERIERASRTRGLDVETRMLASAESQGSTDAAGRLETVRDGVKAHSHFAPRRMLRQAAMAALPTGGEATDADTMDSNTMDGDSPNTTIGVEQK